MRFSVLVYELIDKPIDEVLKAEIYWLYQATNNILALKRFRIADEQGREHDIENQRNWNPLVMDVQEIRYCAWVGVPKIQCSARHLLAEHILMMSIADFALSQKRTPTGTLSVGTKASPVLRLFLEGREAIR